VLKAEQLRFELQLSLMMLFRGDRRSKRDERIESNEVNRDSLRIPVFA
jgi:hypothetical protein